jgi:hypothetical protein
MTTLNLPLVKSEDSFSKNGKMVLVVGIIVIVMLVLMNSHAQYQTDLYIPQYKKKNPVNMAPMEFDCINAEQHNDPVMAKSIILYNLNKMSIPINKIVIIGTDTQMEYFPIHRAVVSHPNKKGVRIRFELPKETQIKEIIIDVNAMYDDSRNITTTQVEVRDSDNTVVWSNCKPLQYDYRYVYLRIVKPKFIYPVMQQKLCNGLSGASDIVQENVLSTIL